MGSDGSLTGYAGGIPKKVGLLTLEQANMSGLFIPKVTPRAGAKDPPTGIKKKSSQLSLIRLSQGFNCLFGAENETRTSRPQPGKVVLSPTELFPQYVSPSAKEAFNLPFRHPKLAFRDCKYKLKNLFCKIFRRILETMSPAFGKAGDTVWETLISGRRNDPSCREAGN